jgi:hypothetical protein
MYHVDLLLLFGATTAQDFLRTVNCLSLAARKNDLSEVPPPFYKPLVTRTLNAAHTLLAS